MLSTAAQAAVTWTLSRGKDPCNATDAKGLATRRLCAATMGWRQAQSVPYARGMDTQPASVGTTIQEIEEAKEAKEAAKAKQKEERPKVKEKKAEPAAISGAKAEMGTSTPGRRQSTAAGSSTATNGKRPRRQQPQLPSSQPRRHSPPQERR